MYGHSVHVSASPHSYLGWRTTTSSSPTTIVTHPTLDGRSYFLECTISSAEEDGAEPRATAVFGRAIYAHLDSTLTLQTSQEVASGPAFVDIVFSTSGTSILVRVDPVDTANWLHWFHVTIHELPLQRYTTALASDSPWP